MVYFLGIHTHYRRCFHITHIFKVYQPEHFANGPIDPIQAEMQRALAFILQELFFYGLCIRQFSGYIFKAEFLQTAEN